MAKIAGIHFAAQTAQKNISLIRPHEGPCGTREFFKNPRLEAMPYALALLTALIVLFGIIRDVMAEVIR